jgi:hypothetical protein
LSLAMSVGVAKAGLPLRKRRPGWICRPSFVVRPARSRVFWIFSIGMKVSVFGLVLPVAAGCAGAVIAIAVSRAPSAAVLYVFRFMIVF